MKPGRGALAGDLQTTGYLGWCLTLPEKRSRLAAAFFQALVVAPSADLTTSGRGCWSVAGTWA